MVGQVGVDGLVSGLNTQQLVSQLMELERQPVYRLDQRRSEYQREQAAWSDLSTKLQALQGQAADIASMTSLAQRHAVSSSDEAAVTATAIEGATAEPGTTSVSVSQLATTGQVASVAELSSPDEVIGAGTLRLELSGEQVTIETVDNATVKDLTRMINDLDVGARARVLKTGEDRFRLVITSRETGAQHDVTVLESHAGIGAMETTQEARDAELSVGGITVRRAGNQIDDLIDGVRLDLHQAGGGDVAIGVERDDDAVVEQVSDLIDSMNQALSLVGELGRTATDARNRGPLAGDSTLRSIATRIRDLVAMGVDTGDGTASLSQLGIELTRTGEVTLDEERLRDALTDDFDAAVGLLSRSTATDDPHLTGGLMSARTASGSYDIEVTQAATRAADASTGYAIPAEEQSFTITQGSRSADVVVAAGASRDEAVAAISAAIADAGLALEARASGDGIEIASTRYGSRGSFETQGMAGVLGAELQGDGLDVEGTIDGVAATGTGQRLRAEDGPAEGLSVEVTVDAATLAGEGGSMTLGPVRASAGFAGNVAALMDAVAGRDGEVARARDGADRRIDGIDDRIRRFEDRLEVRRRTLMRQFTAMEQAMARLQGQGQWLGGQLGF